MFARKPGKGITLEMYIRNTQVNKKMKKKRKKKKIKSVAFSKDKQSVKEIREMTPFIVVKNNTKYLGITLTNQGKDLCDKNFKSLKKEIKEDLRRWKDLPCLWIGRINIIKMAIMPKAI